jgi:hypothetical protein
MFCGNCGAKNDAAFQFCDSCGVPLNGASQQPVAHSAPTGTPAPAPAAQNAFAESTAELRSNLNLTSWAGVRWLLATNYGQLSITDTHLNHQITKFWSSNVYSVIVKIFSWGLDIFSSLFISQGSTALKSITTVRIFALNWIVWKGHFLFIWAGGVPDIYFFSTKQFNEVAGFVAALKKASAEAK